MAFSVLPAMLLRHTGQPQPTPQRGGRLMIWGCLVIRGEAHPESLSWFAVPGDILTDVLPIFPV